MGERVKSSPRFFKLSFLTESGDGKLIRYGACALQLKGMAGDQWQSYLAFNNLLRYESN
jgi:hypothetical protein